MASNIRIRKKPNRYGQAAINLSVQSEDSDPFADNSLDDELYSPHSEDRRCLSLESNEDRNAHNLNYSGLDFESQFDKIDQNTGLDTAAKSPIQEVIAARENGPNQSNESSFGLEILNQLQILNSKTDQLLVRMGVIEESLIKSGTIISIHKEEEKNNEFAVFTKYYELKNMPFKTVDAFKAFEKSLDAISMEEAVS